MHYPRRNSKRKRQNTQGFRTRMKSTRGRKMINRKRRAGRKISVI
ncbi:MAG: 50S ribosomal protein L34 [Phycisphaerae bacterium]